MNDLKWLMLKKSNNQYIRKNAINKKQMEYLIDLLDNQRGKKFDTNYHNYKNQCNVKTIADHK